MIYKLLTTDNSAIARRISEMLTICASTGTLNSGTKGCCTVYNFSVVQKTRRRLAQVVGGTPRAEILMIKSSLQTRTSRREIFVLNTPTKTIFESVINDLDYSNLVNDSKALSAKKIILLDEHPDNKEIADVLKISNKAYFTYEVWHTDHPFTNKRISLINKVLTLLER